MSSRSMRNAALLGLTLFLKISLAGPDVDSDPRWIKSLSHSVPGATKVEFVDEGSKLFLSSDRMLAVVEILTGVERILARGTFSSVTVARDGKHAVALDLTAGFRRARVYDLAAGKETAAFDPGTAYEVAFSEAGRLVIAKDVFRPENGSQPSEERTDRYFDLAHSRYVDIAGPRVSVSPDDSAILSLKGDGAGKLDRVRTFDLDSGKKEEFLPKELANSEFYDAFPSTVYWAGKGNKKVVFETKGIDGRLLTWLDAETATYHVFPEGRELRAFSPDGKYLVTIQNFDTHVFIWGAESGRDLALIEPASAIRPIIGLMHAVGRRPWENIVRKVVADAAPPRFQMLARAKFTDDGAAFFCSAVRATGGRCR